MTEFESTVSKETEKTMLQMGQDLLAAKTVTPVPEAMYPFKVKDLTKEANSKADGFNLVWKFEMYGTGKKDGDGRPYDGRVVAAWTPLPKDGDENEATQSGQTVKEWKLFNIKKILVEGLKLKLDAKLAYNILIGDQATLERLKGMPLRLHLRPGKDQRGEPCNTIQDYKPK